MLHIKIIRHLPTPWNQERKLQGRRDIPIIQPIQAADRDVIEQRRSWFQQQMLIFNAVYVSRLQRTQQTAHAYGYTNYTIDPALDELDFGRYENVDRQIMMDDLQESWVETPHLITLGEPIANLEHRVKDFLSKVNALQNVLVFAHGSWMRALKSFHKYGNISQMNKTTIDNNQMLELDF